MEDYDNDASDVVKLWPINKQPTSYILIKRGRCVNHFMDNLGFLYKKSLITSKKLYLKCNKTHCSATGWITIKINELDKSFYLRKKHNHKSRPSEIVIQNIQNELNKIHRIQTKSHNYSSKDLCVNDNVRSSSIEVQEIQSVVDGNCVQSNFCNNSAQTLDVNINGGTDISVANQDPKIHENEMLKKCIIEEVLDKRIYKGRVEYYVKFKDHNNSEGIWKAEDRLDCKNMIIKYEKLKRKEKHAELQKSKPSNLTSSNGKENIVSSNLIRNRVIEEIISAIKINGKLMFWLKWRGCNDPELHAAKKINVMYPQFVINFYKDKINWPVEVSNI